MSGNSARDNEKTPNSNARYAWLSSLVLLGISCLLSFFALKIALALFILGMCCFIIAIFLELRWIKANLSTARNQIRTVGKIRWQVERLEQRFDERFNSLSQAMQQLQEGMNGFVSQKAQLRPAPPAPQEKARLEAAVNFILTSATDGLLGILGGNDSLQELSEVKADIEHSCYLMNTQDPLPMAKAHGTAGVVIDFSSLPERGSKRDFYYWSWLRHTAPIIAFSSTSNKQDYSHERVNEYSNGFLTTLATYEDFAVLGRRLSTGIESAKKDSPYSS